MTMTRYNEMVEYWSDWPPVHVILMQIFGDPKRKPSAHARESKSKASLTWENESIESLFARWGAVNQTPGLQKPIVGIGNPGN